MIGFISTHALITAAGISLISPYPRLTHVMLSCTTCAPRLPKQVRYAVWPTAFSVSVLGIGGFLKLATSFLDWR